MALIGHPAMSAIGFSGDFCVTLIYEFKARFPAQDSAERPSQMEYPYAIASIVSRATPEGRELKSFRFIGAEDLPAAPAEVFGQDADLPREWVEAEVARCINDSPLRPAFISEVLGSPIGRQFLTGHLLVLYRRGFPADPRDGGSLVKLTARYFAEFVSWGETAAASQIGTLMGVDSMTIRNRLSEARRRGWLAAPGQGARRM